MLPKLCLGTAQFGLDYGVTNKSGKLSQEKISEIVKEAHKEGVIYIDTAQGYGDAETLLGNTNYLKDNFRIINKFSYNGLNNLDKDLIKSWDNNLQKSFRRLRVSKFDSLLIHNSEYLFRKEGNLLINWMESLKERSLVERIGISIYDIGILNKLPFEFLDIIQIPLSIYDQRFLKSGAINQIKRKGISIHVRSIFLQGLILQNASKWPDFFSDSFKLHHKEIVNKLNNKKFNMLEAAICFIYNCPDVESFLVGVTSIQEFKEILKTMKSCKKRYKEFNNLEINLDWNQSDETDPRLW